MTIKSNAASPLTFVFLFVLMVGGCEAPSETTLNKSQNVETLSDDFDPEFKELLLSSKPTVETAVKTPNKHSQEQTKAESAEPTPSVKTTNDNASSALTEKSTQPTAADSDQSIEIPATWKRLGKHEIWVDFKNKIVILGGNICLTAGQLEMFACPAGTKEHESIVAVNAAASELHAALISIGAEPGKPCQWDPEYIPATGPAIDILVRWHDEKKHETITRPAREMIRDFRTKKAMTQQWVFGGSELWEDPATGEKVYYANSGEMICLSNFSTATLDLNVESSQSNDGLLFAAYTENIPPLGTKVYLILKPGQRIGPETNNESPKSDK